MSEINLVPPALLWTYVLARWKARRDRTQRALLLTFGAAAVGATLDVPTAAEWLDRITAPGANVAQVVKHLAVLGAAAGCHEIVRSFALAPARAAAGARKRLGLFAGGAVVLLGLFALAPIHSTEAPDLTVRYATEPVLLAYWSVFLGFLSSALLSMLRLTVPYARRAKPSPLRTSLAAIGLGAAFGLTYAAHKILYLTLRVAGVTTGPVVLTVQNVGAAVLAGGTLFIVGGCSWLALAEHPQVRKVAAQTAYRALTPRCRGLATTTGDSRTGRKRGIEARLYDRVIEIRDAELGLRPWIPEGLAEQARTLAGDSGLPVRLRGPAAEAACLEVARRRRARGDPAVCAPIAEVEDVADFDDEVRALVRVARRRREAIRIADSLD